MPLHPETYLCTHTHARAQSHMVMCKYEIQAREEIGFCWPGTRPECVSRWTDRQMRLIRPAACDCVTDTGYHTAEP